MISYYDLLLEIALGIFPGSSQYACKNWKILEIIAFDWPTIVLQATITKNNI